MKEHYVTLLSGSWNCTHLYTIESTAPLGNLSVDWRIIHRLSIRRVSACRLHMPGSEWGPLASFSDHRNKQTGRKEHREFLDHLREYKHQVLKNNSAPWT